MDWITYTAEEAFGKQIGSGSHFDGTLPDSTFIGSCEGKSGRPEGFSDEYKEYLGRLFEVQADAYEAGAGWVMWAWVSSSRWATPPAGGGRRAAGRACRVHNG